MSEVDTSIYSNIANPLNQISKLNNLTSQNLQNQNLGMDIQSKAAIGNALQQSIDPTTGAPDENKFRSLIAQDPKAAYGMQQGTADSLSRQQAALNQDKQKIDIINQTMSSHFNDPEPDPDAVKADVQKLVDQGLITPQYAANYTSDLTPENTKQKLQESNAYLSDASNRVGSMIALNNGQQQKLFGVNSSGIQPMGTIQNQSPPNTAINNPQTGQPSLLGALPQNNVMQLGNRPTNPMSGMMQPSGPTAPIGPVQTQTIPPQANAGPPSMYNAGQVSSNGDMSPMSNPAMSQAITNAAGPQEASGQQLDAAGQPIIASGPAPTQAAGITAAATDIQKMNTDAQSANKTLAALNSAKGLSITNPESTGPVQAKLLEIIHSNPILAESIEGADKLSSDQLMTKFLQNALPPGDTDAQRASVLAGQPNSALFNKALQRAINYQIGVQTMPVEKINAYNQSSQKPGFNPVSWLSKWAANEDPRVAEFGLGTKEEKDQLKTDLTPQDRAQIANKAKALQQLGAFGGQYQSGK